MTEQIAGAWSKVEHDFLSWPFLDKFRACNRILIPIKGPEFKEFPTNLEKLKELLHQSADINGWDTLPLFQGNSRWLRKPPIYDLRNNGPCATPSSPNPDADDFDPLHEDPRYCSNTVTVAGQCWLNGTVNYGTFGIMVRACSRLANDARLILVPQVKVVYSLSWAKMLVTLYKRFGPNPEAAALPIAWMEATYNGGPRGVPTLNGDPARKKCACVCKCKGDVVRWDYVWEPIKKRVEATPPN